MTADYGDMVITRTSDGLFVNRADDIILITEELLASELDPAVTYRIGGTPADHPHCRVAHRTAG